MKTNLLFNQLFVRKTKWFNLGYLSEKLGGFLRPYKGRKTNLPSEVKK